MRQTKIIQKTNKKNHANNYNLSIFWQTRQDYQCDRFSQQLRNTVYIYKLDTNACEATCEMLFLIDSF